MSGILCFIGGLASGAGLSFFIGNALSASRINSYERIVYLQQKKLHDLAPDDHTCICCGKPVSGKETLCDDCLRNL